MSIVLDVLVVAVVVLFALLGLRKGFLKSLAGLVGAIAALVVALTVSRFLAQWIFDAFLQQPLTQAIADAITESGATTAEGIQNALPGYLQSLLGWTGSGAQALSGMIASSADTVAKAVMTVVSPAVINLLMVVLTIVLFFVFLLLIRLALRLLDKVAKAPVLRQVNGLLGVLFGMGKGLLIVWLLCALATVVVPLWLGDGGAWFRDAINGSYLFGALSSANPISAWMV